MPSDASLCEYKSSSSSADLDEAVNGSLRRLKKSSVCLAYLDDLPADGPPLDESIWRRCRYWKRAWTLQELIVPTKVEFFDKQWNYRGSKASSDLLPLLSSITGVPRSVLLDGNTLSGISLAVRISWSAGRSTRREEDAVYSLAAITGASMLVRYGEVERAFLQLQEEILNDTKDGSIFAWRSVNNQDIRELLARSPSEFHHFATEPESAYQKPWIFDGKPSIPMTNHQKTLDLSRDLDCRTSARISAWFCDRDIHVNIATSEDIEDNNPTGNKVDQRHGPCLQESLKQFNQSNAVGEEFDLPWQPLRFIECPAPSYLGGGFCLLSPAAKISGRKRTNIGDLPSKSPHVQVDMPCPSESDQQKIELEDENGLDGGSSTSGSDSDETLDSALDESLPEDSSVQGRCSPDAPRELQVMRQDLLRFVRQRFITWTASVRYGASSDDEVPPRKRARTVGEQRSQRSEENQVGGEFIIISDLDGHFKLACPFYVSAPRKYRRCFLKTNLQSIKDVICHLRGHHMKPPYCPGCGS
ncbi:hypothetical protein PLIIFM63780_002258 [Purpureocillium lilacinum]|nr:hypothetical protein PLIIFM63780_002258 [Purpureocillium lilacinum]